MRFGDYLEKKQPLVYRTFANAIENKRLAHAYLLCGESGTPLLETAKYMAKSLICDHPKTSSKISQKPLQKPRES